MLAALTFPIFAWVAHSPLDPDTMERPKSLLVGFWLRNWLVWLIRPAERMLVGAGAPPEILSYLGVAFAAAAGFAFAAGSLSLGGCMVLLAGLTDVLDGRIARARRVASEYGSFLGKSLDVVRDGRVDRIRP